MFTYCTYPGLYLLFSVCSACKTRVVGLDYCQVEVCTNPGFHFLSKFYQFIRLKKVNSPPSLFKEKVTQFLFSNAVASLNIYGLEEYATHMFFSLVLSDTHLSPREKEFPFSLIYSLFTMLL